MYDIIPIKGEKYTVNQEHILCLKASGFPKLCRNNHKANTNYKIQWLENNEFCSKTFTFTNNEEEMKVAAETFFEKIKSNPETNDNVYEIAVKDYLKLSDKKKGLLKGYKVGIDFPEKELPIDPYLLGVLLGDGSLSDLGSIELSLGDKKAHIIETLKNMNLNLSISYSNEKKYRVKIKEPKQNLIYVFIVPLGQSMVVYARIWTKYRLYGTCGGYAIFLGYLSP
jgi:hypothetical protein